MWANSSMYPFARPARPPEPRALLGVAWLRVAAAREAYSYGDLDGAQHHVRMATTAAAQALAAHRALPYSELSDAVTSASFCCEQLGPPIKDLIRRMAEFDYVRLTEKVLNDRQHDAVRSGLSASSEAVTLVESVITS
ncbi:MAG: hypothetical protein U1F44_03720 [Coriobacteriia bacterium]|nr:hypothetical protein [Coriobacteriia bacterium]